MYELFSVPAAVSGSEVNTQVEFQSGGNPSVIISIPQVSYKYKCACIFRLLQMKFNSVAVTAYTYKANVSHVHDFGHSFNDILMFKTVCVYWRG